VTHPAEDGFHEIQLTGKQLVFLFMATTVVAVVIFLLGVLVGRNVRNDQAASADAQTAVEPAPVESGAPPQPATGGESAGPTSEDLSYAQRLQGEDPKEQLKGGSAAATAEPPAPAEPEPQPQPESPPPAVSPGSGEAAAPATTRPAPSGWVVQVAALRDRSAAVAIVQRLSRKGYQAFILEPSRGAPAPGYRVRVGPFPDRGQAEQASLRLEREEQFKPFITR